MEKKGAMCTASKVARYQYDKREREKVNDHGKIKKMKEITLAGTGRNRTYLT
jgi:hypothetical protein